MDTVSLYSGYGLIASVAIALGLFLLGFVLCWTENAVNAAITAYHLHWRLKLPWVEKIYADPNATYPDASR